jgi:tRNA(Arg) A34 adenosine deaminase TadA
MKTAVRAATSCKDPQPVDAAVDAPWDVCLALAWTAYCAGTIPAGAVVTDAAGGIVARGRNRIFDGGSRLDHAEVDALRRLPPDRRYEDHVVWSTLEPCLLCVGATLMSTVRTIRYATRDAYGGACSGTIDVPDYVRAGMRIDGPRDDAVARLGSALQAAFWLGRDTPRVREIEATFDVDAGARIRGAAAELPERFEEALPRLLALL